MTVLLIVKADGEPGKIMEPVGGFGQNHKNVLLFLVIGFSLNEIRRATLGTF
jgi:hypothetical protein